MHKLFYFFIALSATLLISSPKEKSISNEGQEKGPQWFSDWYAMKQDASGQIPQLMTHQWALQDAALNKTNAGSQLDSVSSLGPDDVGGRTRAIIVDWADSTHYFAGSVAGGLWESKNEGATWKAVNDNQENLNITAITQSPFNKNIYYYCTGEPYPINDASSNTGGQLGGGVFKSTDGGVTFSVLPSTLTTTFTSTWDIKHALNDSNTIYVSTNNQGLLKSTDGGTTFTNVFVTTAAITHLEVLPNGSIYMSCTGNGIYKSPNGNSGTFTKLSSGFATGSFGRIEFSICKNFPDIMFAVVSTSSNSGLFGTYKSSNGGATWRTTPNASSVGYSYTWFCLTTAICPTDTNKIFVGSVANGFSINGGQNWTINSTYNSHSDYHKLYTINGSNKLLCGNDGGIYRYNWNNLGPFTDLNAGYNVTQYYAGSYFKTGLSVIMGAQDNGSHRILNGNKNSYSLYGADGCFTGINQQDDTKGYFSYQNANIYKASNLKTTPTGSFMTFSVSDSKWFINPLEINSVDGAQIYVPTKTRVHRSTGGTFAPITNTLTKQPYSVALSAENNPVLYFGGSSMLLMRIDSALTTIAGKEKDISTGKPSGLTNDFIGCIKVHKNDKNTIFITLTNYNSQPRVWKISNTNGTPVWTNISGNLPASLPCNSFEYDPSSPDTKFIVATDFGLYLTEDGGTTWTKETKIPNVCIYNIKLRATDRKLFIFTHGRGVWVANVLPYATVKPTANFTMSHVQACENEIITVTDISANNPAQYKWSFENGNPATATSNTATASFNDAGVKKIKLVVTNSFGSDSIEKTITILSNPKPQLVRNGNILTCNISSSGYTWYRNNSTIAPTTQSITADITGWYKLKVNNGNGCFAFSDSVQVFAVGIKAIEQNSSFTFYPNPASVSITFQTKENARVKIYSIEGKCVKSFEIDSLEPTLGDISGLPKGVYLLVFQTLTTSQTYKFVKE